ncbi:MAG: virulence-associated E family protein [Polyangiaceae bacterium]
MIWRLDKPAIIDSRDEAEDWKVFYVGCLAWIERETGIAFDRRCIDWTRLFRLPNVRRERVGTVDSEVYGALGEPWPYGDERWLETDEARKGQKSGKASGKPRTARDRQDDDEEPEDGDEEIVGPLLDKLAGALEGAWSEGRQQWVLPFLGWLKGKGFSEHERHDLLLKLTEVRDDGADRYFDMNERTHKLDGPNNDVKEALGDDFAEVDKLVNSHPNNARGALALAGGGEWEEHLQVSRDKQGNPTGAKANLGNVLTVLAEHESWRGIVAYDEFANRIVLGSEPPMRTQDAPRDAPGCPREWQAEDTTRTAAWLSMAAGFTPKIEDVKRAVATVARKNSFHPVREYLKALEWDGTKRLDTVLRTYFSTADTEYTSAVGAKFMIAAVARVMGPWPVKADDMLILQGAQGRGKSTGLRALFGDAWFSDTSIDFSNKDAYIVLRSKWCIEIAELDGFDRADAKRVKAFLSSPVDNYRAPFGESNQDWPRQCVFAGTTNEEQFLADRTGNRRYWPVSVLDQIDVEAIRRDRDQLWAEAVSRFDTGEKWWLTPSEESLAKREQAAREIGDSWEETIKQWAGRQDDYREGFSLATVLAEALSLQTAQRTPAAEKRAAQALKRSGFERRQVRGKGNWRSREWRYVPKDGA